MHWLSCYPSFPELYEPEEPINPRNKSFCWKAPEGNSPTPCLPQFSSFFLSVFACVGVRGGRGHIQSLDNSSSLRILSCWAQRGCRSVRWEVRRWSVVGGAGWRWGSCINNASPLATAVGALSFISSGYATVKNIFWAGMFAASGSRWKVPLNTKGVKIQPKLLLVFAHEWEN